MSLRLNFALAILQKVMDNILTGIQNERALVYMNETIVFFSTN